MLWQIVMLDDRCDVYRLAEYLLYKRLKIAGNSGLHM